MACVVIGDITNISLSLHKERLFGAKGAVEYLFTLYIVCNICVRNRI